MSGENGSSRRQGTLIVGPSWIGDMVMAQALFIRLRQLTPSSALDVLAPPWSRPLLARMPEVHRALDWPFAHGELRLADRYRLGRSLRENAYARAIVLPNSFKSALVPRFAAIPQRTGWRGEMRGPLLNDCRRLDPERYPLMVQRFVALADVAGEALPDPLPRPALKADGEGVKSALRALGLQGERPMLALCPGAAFGSAKQWPTAHYSELARHYCGEGWQVCLFGAEAERGITGAIRETLPDSLQSHCLDLAGRTSLGQAIDLLSCADAVVSNDSGLMHVAAALNRPVLALYGSTSPDFTPPMANRVKLLTTDIECRPCFQRECPLGHRACLTEIRPGQVIEQMQELLDPAYAGLPETTTLAVN